MEKLISFFIDNIPSSKTILIAGPVFLLWAYCCLSFAGYLKTVRHVKTGYSRKTFHLLIFLTATVLQFTAGLPIVCLLGGMTTIILAYALFRGSGHSLYEGIAREKDAPYQTFFIVVPYFATLVGGLVNNIFFGQFVIIGYLVGGLGDAAGEPVGTRWGKHKYTVPSFGSFKSTRSIEGSLGVFLVSLFSIIVGSMLLPNVNFNLATITIMFLMAASSALLEAVSPHGWDNTTMQIVPALLAYLFLQ